MEETPKRRWFAFRLRTLFVMVAVLSVPLAWAGYSLNWIRERQHLLRADGVRFDVSSGDICNPAPWAPRGLWLFGERPVCEIYVPIEQGETASRLFPEANINVKFRNRTGDYQPWVLFQLLRESQDESPSSIAPAPVP
jgi:hypothetical protein